jgi:hypothetical protein
MTGCRKCELQKLLLFTAATKKFGDLAFKTTNQQFRKLNNYIHIGEAISN